MRFYDGTAAYRVADLKARGWSVTSEDVYPEWPEEACLCGVDVPAVLERAGVRFTEDDLGDYLPLHRLPVSKKDTGSTTSRKPNTTV